MKQSIANFARAAILLLLFMPGPMAVVNATPAMAAPQATVAAPAVEVPAAEAEKTEDPWTARFLAPVSVAVAVVAIGASGLYYIVRIRGRYRVG